MTSTKTYGEPPGSARPAWTTSAGGDGYRQFSPNILNSKTVPNGLVLRFSFFLSGTQKNKKQKRLLDLKLLTGVVEDQGKPGEISTLVYVTPSQCLN